MSMRKQVHKQEQKCLLEIANLLNPTDQKVRGSNPFARTIHGIFTHFSTQSNDPPLRLFEVIKGDDKGLRAQ
jgi:hypothetical protein